jgi:Ca2+-transporting ATPase
MRRPPRDRAVGLFSRETLGIALLQGGSILVVCLGVFLMARREHPVDAARAHTFVTMVVAFLMVILVNRSWTESAVAMLRIRNVAVVWVLVEATVLLAVAVSLPLAQRLFHFAPLHPPDLLLSLGAGLLCVLWFEGVKLVRGRRARGRVLGREARSAPGGP